MKKDQFIDGLLYPLKMVMFSVKSPEGSPDLTASEVTQGFSARGAGRVALVLLNLCHPEDEEGDYHEAEGRIEG